jgi:hypothetical protein
MITILKQHLAATLPTMAEKDIRFYLNGALIEVTQCGQVHLISTDGHVMLVGRIRQAWTNSQPEPMRLIIPREVVAQAAKGRTPETVLAQLDDTRWTLGDIVFTPIDGKFPDWRRVNVTGTQLGPEKPAQYNPAALARCNEALARWSANKKHCCTHLHMRGNDAGVMTTLDADVHVIVMPWRVKGDFKNVMPFTPAPFTK